MLHIHIIFKCEVLKCYALIWSIAFKLYVTGEHIYSPFITIDKTSKWAYDICEKQDQINPCDMWVVYTRVSIKEKWRYNVELMH